MKKTYSKPQSTLVLIASSTALLAGSGDPDVTDKGEGGPDPNTAKQHGFFEDDLDGDDKDSVW